MGHSQECRLSLGPALEGMGGEVRDNVKNTVGTSDFDAQMSGIEFWKGDENLRHVYKKPFSKY